MLTIPKTFHDGYAILYANFNGDPISDSPFRKNKDLHQVLRDHMSTDDWMWAEGHMVAYDKAAARKWENFKLEQMTHLLCTAERCDDSTFNIRFTEWLRVRTSLTFGYTSKQKASDDTWRQLWALYSKTVETIYKMKHHPDHPEYTGDGIFNPNSLFE